MKASTKKKRNKQKTKPLSATGQFKKHSLDMIYGLTIEGSVFEITIDKIGFTPFINEITHKCHLFNIKKNTWMAHHDNKMLTI